MSQTLLNKKKQREESVLDSLKRRITSYAKLQEWECFIDKIPANQKFGRRGRPDLYIDLGPYHIRIEVKDKRGKESGYQETWRERHHKHHNPWMHYLVVGHDGADDFMDQLPLYLESYRLWFESKI